MKYIVIFLTIVSVGLLATGLYFNLQDNPLQHKFFGFGTILLFLVTFPTFLFWRRNKFDMDKYTWKNEKDNKSK